MNGSLEDTEAGPRLRFLHELVQPREVLWRALTEPEQLQGWFPQRVSVERWEVGASLRFAHPRVPEASFDGRVLACEPPRLLACTWGPDVLRFELEPLAGRTSLIMFDTIEQSARPRATPPAGTCASSCSSTRSPAARPRGGTLNAGAICTLPTSSSSAPTPPRSAHPGRARLKDAATIGPPGPRSTKGAPRATRGRPAPRGTPASSRAGAPPPQQRR